MATCREELRLRLKLAGGRAGLLRAGGRLGGYYRRVRRSTLDHLWDEWKSHPARAHLSATDKGQERFQEFSQKCQGNSERITLEQEMYE